MKNYAYQRVGRMKTEVKSNKLKWVIIAVLIAWTLSSSWYAKDLLDEDKRNLKNWIALAFVIISPIAAIVVYKKM